jgi:DNA-binding Lrp family transcriptional regulator
MESRRLPRFKRAPTVAAVQLTERDRAIIRLVHRHHFLRSSHIVSLIGGSPQHVLRRLQLLYHQGFLDRPRIQIEYYHQGGSRQIVYGLGSKGASLLKHEPGANLRYFQAGGKNDPPHRFFFEHALLVSDIMVALELACGKVEGIRLLAGDELPLPGGVRLKLKWKVKLNNRVLLGIIPDRVFALVSGKESPDINPTFFFLEADRGTMPVVRKNLAQTSFYRKLLAYETTWARGLHRSQFGFHRFRVLTVTTSAARVESLVQACSQLKSGHGLFLFCDQATLQKHGNILTVPWKIGRQGETTSILG